MAQSAKYLFDRNFEQPVVAADPPEVVVERELRAEFEAQIARVRDEEYQRGRADGEREALQSLDAQTSERAAALVDQSQQILEHIESECDAIRADAIRIAAAAADRLAGELVRREPATLLEGLFAQCLEHLGDAPHIAIRVDTAVAERLQEKVNAVATERGFAGKIIVLGDPETPHGDCRIEWADGGLTRDFDSLRGKVNEIVERHLAGHGNPPAQRNGSSANGHGSHDAGTAPSPAPAPASALAAAPPAPTNGSGDHP